MVSELQPFGRIPYSPNHYQLVLDAISLLTSNTARDQWFKAANRYWRQLPEELNPAKQFEAKVDVIDSEHDKSSHSFLERPEYLQNARVQYIRDVNEDDPRFHIDIHSLANVLGLHDIHIRTLIDSKALTFSNRSSNSSAWMMKSRIFNIKLAFKHLKKFTRPLTATSVVKVTPSDIQLGRYLCDYEELLSAILKKEIKGYFPSVFELNTAIVCKDDYESWLIEQREFACTGAVSIQKAALALGVSENEVRELVKTSNLFWAKYYTASDEYVDGYALLKYIK